MRAVIEKDHGWRRIVRNLKQLDGKTVEVGLRGTQVNADGDNIAAYAAWNEFGTARIPSRPFMRTAFDQGLPGLLISQRASMARMYSGAFDPVLVAMESGEFMQTRIRASILAWTSPPNAPYTIKRKGFNDPLIETGAMYDAIDYWVRP